MAKRVAIIGAGLSGLVTLKECLQEGLEADCYEGLSTIGGQWAYADPNPVTGEVVSSVYPGIVVNSCRETGVFSDFPMDPAKYAHFFSHRRYLEYFKEYAEYFGLNRHIHLNTKVSQCTQLPSGQWSVIITSKGGGAHKEIYDAVFACSGHHSDPKTPAFTGLAEFKGDIIHSHVYRTPARFEGKRVAIIGLGNSAADIACEITPLAKEVHLITRKGRWVAPRYVFGKPAETLNSRFGQQLPASVTAKLQRTILDFVQGEHPASILPKCKINEGLPIIRSDFLEKIRTGEVNAHRGQVDRITSSSLIMNGDTEIEVDSIVMATGYHLRIPYLPEDAWKSTNPDLCDIENAADLYKLIQSVKYQNLFFIGLLAIPGAQTAIAEAQARWSVAAVTGKITLPTPSEMVQDVRQQQERQQKRFARHDNLTMSLPFLEYCDSLAAPLGASPTFWNLLTNVFTSGAPLRSWRVLVAVYMGLAAPAQYRLFGRHCTPELAAETILRSNRLDAVGFTSKETEMLESMKTR